MATPIPYRSLFKTAALTVPLLTLAFSGPILIFVGFEDSFFYRVLPALFVVCTMAWGLNIAFLKFRDRLGKWGFLQIFIIGGLMILISFVLYWAVHPQLPAASERLISIRYINAFAVNAIIYILIDLRLLSDIKARLAEENAALRLSQVETQYQALRDQLNPHFLFNALGTARSLVRRDPVMAEAYIIRLSELLRSTLQDSRDHVALADELRLVRAYVELQQMRFQDALQFVCDPELQLANMKLPSFSLLTLVENAVKHNHMSAEEPLRVEVKREGDRISVRNNRRSKVMTDPTIGSGLTNLERRLRMLGHGAPTITANDEHFEVSFALLPP